MKVIGRNCLKKVVKVKKLCGVIFFLILEKVEVNKKKCELEIKELDGNVLE